MWHSRLFWRLFLSFAAYGLALIVFPGIVLLTLARSPAGDPPPVAPLLGTALLVALVAALFLARRLARGIVEPVRELTRAAESLVAGGHGRKVYLAGRDEIARLARTFNHMSEHLAGQVAQLDADRQQLRTILSGMVEGVVALDAQERILFANVRAAELLEFDPQAAVGRRFWEVVRQRPLQEVVRKALDGGSPARQELSWNGSAARSLAVHAASLPGPQWGRSRGAVVVLQDTSELRRLEQHRREFVANVSHELKTPLSVIKACTETLIGGAMDDLAHRGSFLERIDRQADRLQALILDLLSLARIEAGTETFDFAALPLGPIVADCFDRLRDRAEARNQALEAVPPPEGEDAPAWADEEAVGQILDNLVDNAIKYSPPGSRIWVRWRAEPEHVRLDVEDNGTGIPAHDLPRIFERFYRVDKARSRELGGTGLGLSIVKHLAQAMRGSVRARSRLGHGTTFTVCLPRRTDS